jgi:hypothetical protein
LSFERAGAAFRWDLASRIYAPIATAVYAKSDNPKRVMPEYAGESWKLMSLQLVQLMHF